MALMRSVSMETEDMNRGITAIAIDRDRNSHYAVKWAVENILKDTVNPFCFLVHVQSKTLHPDDFEGSPRGSRPPSQQELQVFFLPFRGFCARKGIETKEVVLYDLDVPSALIDFIGHNPIDNFVVGASTRSALTRKFLGANVPGSLLKSAPKSCAIHVISKGKVQTSRPAVRPQAPADTSATSFGHPQMSNIGIGSPRQPQTPRSCLPSPKRFEDLLRMDMSPVSLEREDNERLSYDGSNDYMQISPVKKNLGSGFHVLSPMASIERDGGHPLDVLNRDSFSDATDLSGPSSIQSPDTSPENLEHCNSSISTKSFMSPNNPNLLEEELKRLKLELKRAEQLYNTIFKEATLAKQMARELQQLQVLGECKLQEARFAEKVALALAEAESQKSRAAIEAAEMAQRLAEMEARKRKKAEVRMKREAEEKKKLLETLSKNVALYRRYSVNEIEVATDYFANANKIGEGGYGPVYKGVLNHTTVAIKVLWPNLSKGQMQFQKEVEVLSTIRHPHMVMLVGACPEYGSLVYEYMDNGSLEDRLFVDANTIPIPWRRRFIIASEIATALLFLHETKPEPLVHRDLKPANILIDKNYVSKIGDVGLARLIPPSIADDISQCHMTAAAGTLYYIDPEYQQSGKLSVKSDLYSFGVVLLQLITGMPPMGLAHQVQAAIENGTFADILDHRVTDWPQKDACSLANLALKCCELRKKDRPDLASVILPELIRLRDLALADEIDESEIVSTLHLQGQLSTTQMSTRRKGPTRFKSMNKFLSFKWSSERHNTPPARGENQGVRRGETMQPQGCWTSIVRCG